MVQKSIENLFKKKRMLFVVIDYFRAKQVFRCWQVPMDSPSTVLFSIQPTHFRKLTRALHTRPR